MLEDYNIVEISGEKSSKHYNSMLMRRRSISLRVNWKMSIIKVFIGFILVSVSKLSLAHKKEQNWNFISIAGLPFAMNPPTALLYGSIGACEGFSKFSDDTGSLEICKDGIRIFDKQIPNGIGFMGDSSSAKSDFIAPRPAYRNKFYLPDIKAVLDHLPFTQSYLNNCDVNLFSDTTRVCGSTITLDAGSGFTNYLWSNGATTQAITITTSGKYKVTVTNASGCSASDSTYVSLVKSDIINKDTTICKGASITLHVDSMFSISSGSIFPENLRNGLVGYWPFNGNANDESGNGNHGVSQGALLSSDRFGNANRSYEFDGIDDYIQVPNSSSITLLGDLTISAWVYTRGRKNQNYQTVVSKRETYWTWEYSLSLSYHIGIPHNGLTGFSRAIGMGAGEQAFSQTPYKPGVWEHWVATVSNGKVNIYRNGVLDKSQNFSMVPNKQNCPLLFGRNTLVDNSEQFFGKIDDIAIYNRALTASEVQQLFNFTTVTWSTGANTNSIIVTPTQTTKYYVTVSDGITSCRDSVTVNVATPDTSIQALTPTQICASGGGSVSLQAGTATTYQWLRNGALVNGASSRQFNAILTGDYRVIVADALGCTDTSRTIPVSLSAPPMGTLLTPTTDLLCSGGSIKLTATGGASYRWLLNGNQVAITSEPDYLAALPGLYTVNIVSADGCVAAATGSVTLKLVQRPTADFIYNTYCEGIPIQFSNLSNTTNSPGGVSYGWNFGSGQGMSTLQNPTYTYTNSGNYLVSLVVTPNSCPSLSASVEKNITVERPVDGIRYQSLNAIVNKPLSLTARTFGILYQWIPGINLNNSQIRTPIFISSQEQQYRIQITTAAGCVTIDTLQVRVFKEREIYVPQGFTPNNDGQNDRLYPITVGIMEMRVFRVYNRWGNLVYNNANANALSGWDGYYKGTPAPMDTYAWVAEGTDVDGNPISRKGNVVLIR